MHCVSLLCIREELLPPSMTTVTADGSGMFGGDTGLMWILVCDAIQCDLMLAVDRPISMLGIKETVTSTFGQLRPSIPHTVNPASCYLIPAPHNLREHVVDAGCCINCCILHRDRG